MNFTKYLKASGVALAALVVLSQSALPAYAAVDRAFVEGFSSGSDISHMGMIVHFGDGSSVSNADFLNVPLTGVGTSQDLINAGNAAISTYASGHSYTLSTGTIWPFLTPDQITALATPVYYNGSVSTGSKVLTFATTTLSGAATVYLTDNGLASGNALCSGTIEHVNLTANDSGNTFGLGYTVTNSNKTLTITANVRSFSSTTILGISVLGGSSLAAATNGTSLGVLVVCN